MIRALTQNLLTFFETEDVPVERVTSGDPRVTKHPKYDSQELTPKGHVFFVSLQGPTETLSESLPLYTISSETLVNGTVAEAMANLRGYLKARIDSQRSIIPGARFLLLDDVSVNETWPQVWVVGTFYHPTETL